MRLSRVTIELTVIRLIQCRCCLNTAENPWTWLEQPQWNLHGNNKWQRNFVTGKLDSVAGWSDDACATRPSASWAGIYFDGFLGGTKEHNEQTIEDGRKWSAGAAWQSGVLLMKPISMLFPLLLLRVEKTQPHHLTKKIALTRLPT